MCVTWDGTWEKTKEDMVAYKAVRIGFGGTITSPLPPTCRRGQYELGGRGELFVYQKGEVTE